MPIGIVVAAGVTAAGAVAAANSSASGEKDAAQLQTDAANHGADITAKTNADTLAWQKQEAEQTYQQAETDRRANYDQWAAHMGGVNSVGQMLGFGRKPVPGYVPSVDPRYVTAPPPNGPPVTVTSPQQGQTSAPGHSAPSIAQLMPPQAAAAPAAPPQLAFESGLDPALMGGNRGYTGGMGQPVRMPDGTWRYPPPRAIGSYLGGA